MAKFIILYLIILFISQSIGKVIDVQLKIKNDWEEKREFIYLKNVELKQRFVVKMIEKHNNQFNSSFDYNIERFLHLVKLNSERNSIYNVKINDGTYSPTYILRKKIMIEIANNEIIQQILPEFEKRVFYILFNMYCNEEKDPAG